jgi:hypothetical protein
VTRLLSQAIPAQNSCLSGHQAPFQERLRAVEERQQERHLNLKVWLQATSLTEVFRAVIDRVVDAAGHHLGGPRLEMVA